MAKTFCLPKTAWALRLEPQNPIVNTRSFGANPQTVARLGVALCQGLTDGGVLNSIKHFPGHGRTTQDSHLGLPVLHRTKEQLDQNELVPFRAALPVADSVMIGHLLLPALDGQNPASLSPAVITELLVKQMGYEGLILTDALCMKAIGDEKQASLKALHAGAHILLSAQDSVALSDFLQTKKGLEPFIVRSIQRQDQLVNHLLHTPKIGLSADAFNTRYCTRCAVWQGQALSLLPGQKVSYLELGNEESFVAQSFLQALQDQGVQVKKFDSQADTLLAVSFSNFKAFKGHINLSSEEKTRLTQAALNAKRSLFISFGSPFGTQQIPLSARLFMFSPATQAQICAAQILCGKVSATGTCPF